MFSGIVESVARVRRATRAENALTLELETGHADLALGESVAVNGVCLTVAAMGDAPGVAEFFASAETLARTNLGGVAVGDPVNTERAVSADTRLSGHLVQGHIDGRGTIAAIRPDAGAHILAIDLPAGLARYCVEKGSIALDGISLTLNRLERQPDGGARASITIIPHTFEHTNLKAAAAGDTVNVEVDVIAKYVERLCQPYLAQ